MNIHDVVFHPTSPPHTPEVLGITGNINSHLRYLQWNWHSAEMSTDVPEDRRWWEFWKIDEERKKNLLVIGRYLLEALDDFVKIASKHGNPLALKATILDSVASLYDSVAIEALPLWTYPFRGSIRHIVVNVIASLLTDYIVTRYDAGEFS